MAKIRQSGIFRGVEVERSSSHKFRMAQQGMSAKDLQPQPEHENFTQLGRNAVSLFFQGKLT